MNLEPTPPVAPLQVIITNPLADCSHLLMVKLLSGVVFGSSQPVHLRLLTDSDGVAQVLALKRELEHCAFECIDGIDIYHEFHSKDLVLSVFNTADVVCIMTAFPNPNRLLPKDNCPATVEALQQITMIAKFLDEVFSENKGQDRLLVMADGLISLHVLKHVCKNVRPQRIYCPTPLTAIAKSVLGDYLKVKCPELNELLVWAANDDVFHVGVQKPLILQDISEGSKCDWELIGKTFKESLPLDHIQFNESWIKNNFMEKVKTLSLRNPYGTISRAHSVAAALKLIWASFRRAEPAAGAETGAAEVAAGAETGAAAAGAAAAGPAAAERKVYCSMGVISCGVYYGLERGLPCVLPLIIEEGKWSINSKCEQDVHVRSEMKRINKAAKELAKELMFWRDKVQVLGSHVSENSEIK